MTPVRQTISNPYITPLTFESNISQLNEFSAGSDAMAKIRMTEEALQNEKRARAVIEAEVQNGRILMASLSARVDRLQEMSMTDEAMIRDMSKKQDLSDQQIREMGQQLSMRSDRDTLKLQQMLQEVISKQRNVDSLRQEQEGQNRVVIEQLNHMRYKMEAYVLKTEQVGSDLNVKTRDWINESQKGVETMKAVKDHDQALHSLHSVVDSSADALARKFDAAQFEIRQRFDSELRARQLFETNVRELCSEWRKVVQNQERELIDRIESIRQGMQSVIEREGSSREKSIQGIISQQREFEKEIKDSRMSLMEQFSQQIRSVEVEIASERQNTKEMESRIQQSTNEGSSIMQSSMNKRLAESYEQNINTKYTMSQIAKALQDSIVVADKASSSKLKSLEDVLRAEIKSRMDTDATMSGLAAEIKKNIEMIQENTENKLQDFQEQQNADIAQLEESSRATAEDATQSALRSISMIDVEVQRLSKSLKNQETGSLLEKKDIRDQLEALSNTLDLKLEDTKLSLLQEISSGQQGLDLSSRFEELDTGMKSLEARVEDKFNFKTVQIDSTMDAFKEELEFRVTVDDMKRLDLDASSMRESLEMSKKELNSNLDMVRQSLGQYSTKVDQESGQKVLSDLLSTMSLSANELESQISELQIVLESKINKSDLSKLNDKNEKVMADFRDTKLELSKLIEEMTIKVENGSTVINGIDDRFINIEVKLRECDLSNEKSAVEFKTIYEKLATVHEVDEKYNSITETIHDTLNAMQSAIMDRKEEVADLEDSVGIRMDEHTAKIENEHTESLKKYDKFKKDVEESLDQLNDKLTKKITEAMSTFESSLLKQKSSAANLETELIERSKMFNEKIQEVFQTIEQVSDGRDEQQDDIQTRFDSITTKVEDLEELISLKLSKRDLERQRAEFEDQIQKVQDSIEQELGSIEHIQKRLSEQDEEWKEKHSGLNLSIERSTKDQLHSTKVLKDLVTRRIDSIENKIKKTAPPVGDDFSSEIKDMRQELKNQHRSISKNEGDIYGLKRDLKSTITERLMDSHVMNIVSPLQRKLYDIQEAMDALSDHRNRASSIASAQHTNTVYKPADMSFGDKSKSRPRSSSSFQNQNSSPNRSRVSLYENAEPSVQNGSSKIEIV